MDFLTLSDYLKDYLKQFNFSPENFNLIHLLLGLGILFIVLYLSVSIFRLVILKSFFYIITKTKPQWQRQLVKNRVFRSVAIIIIAYILYSAVPILFINYPKLGFFALAFSKIYMVFTVISAVNAFLNALVSIMEMSKKYNDKPLRSYKQVAKILIYIIGFVLVLSIMLNQSPLYIFGGFGAVTAVMLLIFRDPILGFVASVQMSAIDLVRIGDWITVDKYGADGEVIEINLTTIKVRNFDKTLTIVPSYAIVSESFKNWRAMEESEGRRIKRHINIKISSIRFIDDELYQKLLKIQTLEEYLTSTHQEIQTYNQSKAWDTTNLVNGRHMTNIGTFRYYAEKYLENNPNINTNMTFMVRQLQATEHGLPIEIYVFSKEKKLKQYEEVAADIFDHLYAAVPYFDLEIFQSPSGSDMRKFNN